MGHCGQGKEELAGDGEGMLRRKQINSPGWKPGNQKVTWGKLSPEDVMGYITFLSEVSKER